MRARGWIPCHDGPAANGFALVVCTLLLAGIGVLAVAMLSLAHIQLRGSAEVLAAERARANARLALMQALGQLQRTLGPDQRISATAEILGGSVAEPHWTGVWRSTRDDGSPFLVRDPDTGSLRDTRNEEPDAAGRVIEWLVSDSPAGPPAAPADAIRMVGSADKPAVRAPAVGLRNSAGRIDGRLAWWTGDLGVRADIGTHDPRSHVSFEDGAADADAWFRVMLSQAPDIKRMDGGVEIDPAAIARLATANSAALECGGEWAGRNFFDFTVASRGVLADVARGGLKRDLTAWLGSDGALPQWRGLDGLSDETPLIGAAGGDETDVARLSPASPTFGRLRDWARAMAPLAGGEMRARLSEADPAAGAASEALALANETPVKLAGNRRAALQPVLVEATNFIHISAFPLAGYSARKFQLRHHLYPRVVLWNPYNVPVESDRLMIMIQGNGRQEMWTENVHYNSLGNPYYYSRSQWLSFEGGRSTSFSYQGGHIMATEGYNDPYIGSYYFTIPATRFEPGECLVFSPAKLAEYDCLSPYRPGSYNLAANELTCHAAPDPSRCYYVSGTDIGGGISYRPIYFWYAPTPYWSQGGRSGVENQADDTRAVLKSIGNRSVVTFEDFDALPQVAVISGSLQYGAGREPRIAWHEENKMPIELLDQFHPQPTVVPDVRTRESVRLRWFEEHMSNIVNSGALAHTPHFEEALLANWNPRAAFAVRSPWENVAGSLPVSGSAGGPWFFGAYTRDLYDQDVSWHEQTPVSAGGRCRGNPFGPPQEGRDSVVIFDVPRDPTGVISLGQMQHAPLSDLVWHPSFAIGNSLADPRLGLGGLDATVPAAASSTSDALGGFHDDDIGWSSDAQRSAGRSEWAEAARALLGNVPEDASLVYDLSFEANRALWDRYFLSTGTAEEKKMFLLDPGRNPLPNGRMRPAPGVATADELTDFHRAASRLWVDGAFNVNSTRVGAWKALLGSTRLARFAGGETTPFPRGTPDPDSAWSSSDGPDRDEAWSGYRTLTPAEIDALARAIVDQVKLRAPFVSLADFVNRRLADDETGRMGALEAAIRAAGLNSAIAADLPLDNSNPLPDYPHPDNLPDATRLEQTLKPDSKAWGIPGWLTQGDVLQTIGPVLTARSDSFLVRAYGDAVDAGGRPLARAWCEAVVQRLPQPLDPDETGLNPRNPGAPTDFGRQFAVTSFRWLNPAEL